MLADAVARHVRRSAVGNWGVVRVDLEDGYRNGVVDTENVEAAGPGTGAHPLA